MSETKHWITNLIPVLAFAAVFVATRLGFVLAAITRTVFAAFLAALLGVLVRLHPGLVLGACGRGACYYAGNGGCHHFGELSSVHFKLLDCLLECSGQAFPRSRQATPLPVERFLRKAH